MADNIHNAANNVNGVLSSRNDVYTRHNTDWFSLMTNYVRKVVDTVNGYNNVIYEIGNEMPFQSYDFQTNLVQLIREYEATKPKQHPVGITSFDYLTVTQDLIDVNSLLAGTAADWYSPEGGDFDRALAFMTNPPPVTASKVALFDTDHMLIDVDDYSCLWRTFLRGYCPINQDTPGSGYWNFPVYPKKRTTMGVIAKYSKRVSMETMVIANAVASSGFCLTNAAGEYLAYQTNSSALRLKLPAGNYYYEKFNPITGAILAKAVTTVPTAGEVTWSNPAAEFVLYCALNGTPIDHNPDGASGR